MIQPLFEHRRSFAGYESRVLELEGDGVPVVLFHGYGDSADTWRQLLALLSLPAPVPSPVLRAAVARLYAALAFGSPRAIDRGVVSAFTSHHRDRATVAGYLETARRLIGELRDPFALERIEVPVLLVWGDRDRLVFNRGAQRVPQEVPGARLQLLPGVGHCPQVEAHERLARLLLRFADQAAVAAV